MNITKQEFFTKLKDCDFLLTARLKFIQIFSKKYLWLFNVLYRCKRNLIFNIHFYKEMESNYPHVS